MIYVHESGTFSWDCKTFPLDLRSESYFGSGVRGKITRTRPEFHAKMRQNCENVPFRDVSLHSSRPSLACDCNPCAFVSPPTLSTVELAVSISLFPARMTDFCNLFPVFPHQVSSRVRLPHFPTSLSRAKSHPAPFSSHRPKLDLFRRRRSLDGTNIEQSENNDLFSLPNCMQIVPAQKTNWLGFRSSIDALCSYLSGSFFCATVIWIVLTKQFRQTTWCVHGKVCIVARFIEQSMHCKRENGREGVLYYR